MRTYAGLLVLEDLFNYVPTANPDIYSFADQLFNPSVQVIEEDCHTTLGSLQDVNYELEGHVELATGEIISKQRIENLLFHGIYKVAVRTLDTCVSPGGICQKCYQASRPKDVASPVGYDMRIQPEYEIATTTISGEPGVQNYTLEYDPVAYNFLYVYVNGVLMPDSFYSVSGKTFTLTDPLTEVTYITIRYTGINRSPFLVWLAKTYSGSMMGMQPLPAPMLPIRSALLASLIPQNRLELLMAYTQTLTQIPEELKSYMPQIRNPLERALYMLALNCAFANVTS